MFQGGTFVYLVYIHIHIHMQLKVIPELAIFLEYFAKFYEDNYMAAFSISLLDG